MHQQITAVTGTSVFSCDAHSPWQRDSTENMNGLGLYHHGDHPLRRWLAFPPPSPWYRIRASFSSRGRRSRSPGSRSSSNTLLVSPVNRRFRPGGERTRPPV